MPEAMLQEHDAARARALPLCRSGMRNQLAYAVRLQWYQGAYFAFMYD